MTNFFKKYKYLIIVAVFVLLAFSYNFFKKKSIDKRMAIVYTHKIIIRKCFQGSECLEYHYYVKGIEYNGLADILGKGCCKSIPCLKRKYKVEYDSLHPSNSRLTGYPCEKDW